MKIKSKKNILLAVAVLLGGLFAYLPTALAQMSSTSYKVQADLLGGGGDRSTSTGFIATDSVGELGAIEEMTSTSYKACVGFQCALTAAPGGGGGGGGGPTPDTTPPAISGVTATSITNSSATIQWNTNEAATSQVQYGLTTGYGSQSSQAAYLTGHSQNLTGLAEGTLYHYKVCSTDSPGNTACSGDFTFTTTETTAPIISNVVVSEITTTSAKISWTTNEASDSTVDFGLASGPPYSSTTTNPALVTSHEITLTGLTENTVYYFRIRSKDASNNEAATTDDKFSTAITPDTTAPVISNIIVSNITTNSAVVGWDTDEAADTTVEYGLTTSYGSTSTSATMVTDHGRTLTGLSSSTTYHFRVKSKDAANNEAISADGTFTTITPGAPLITTIEVINITQTSATVRWDTDVDSDSKVDYGETTAYGSVTTNATITQNHSVNLTGLQKGTTYNFKVTSTDTFGQAASSTNRTFATLADTVPPANVSNFTATPGDSEVTLNWTNPPDADFVGVRIVRKTTGFPTGPNDGTLIHDGAGTLKLDTSASNGNTYYYGAFAHDDVPNYASGALASADLGTADTTPPAGITNFAVTAGDSIAQLTWTNPTDPDWTGTLIVRKTGSQSTGPSDGQVVFDGTADNYFDSGLQNDSIYYYTAYAHDAVPNYAPGATENATPTFGAPPPPPPACGDTDGGNNPDTQGTVSENGVDYNDTCIDSNTLEENFCSNGQRASQVQSCASGTQCSSGRCIAVEPQPAAADQRISRSDVEFYSTTGNIRLQMNSSGEIQSMTAMSIRIYIPDAAIKKPINTATITFAGSTYRMVQVESYEATIANPSNPGSFPLNIDITYQDGTTDSIDFTMIVEPSGVVFEEDGGVRTAVASARVTLLIRDGSGQYVIWQGSDFGQVNPQTTTADGSYRYIVSPGWYILVAEKDEYRTKETLAFPADNIINRELQLIKTPPPPVEEIQKILDGEGSIAEKAGAIAGVLGDSAGYAAKIVADQVIEIADNPFVEQQTEQIAAPTVAAVAAANVAAAGAASANAAPLALYLYSLVTHPILLIGRRRRKKWGVVYNSLSKLPIDLAIVRLLDAKSGRIVRSAVTDKDGRYFFIVQPGEYKIAAIKAGYVFPSVYLKGQKEDIQLVDLYHGEPIIATEETTITANIPMDPVVVEKPSRKIKLEGVGRRLQKSVGVVAIIAMGIAVLITPTPLVLGLFAVNVVMYFVFKRLSVSKRPKSWGIVYDVETKKPVGSAVARIFEAKYNKLLESQITDSNGHYSFLVGSNVYYVTFEKAGYHKQQQGPVDLVKVDTRKPGEKIVTLDVPLARAKPGETAPPLKPMTATVLAPSAPTAPTTPPPATPPSAAPSAPSAPIVPPTPAATPTKQPGWEMQVLERLKKQQGGGGTPPASAPPSTPSAPPAPPAPSSPPPAPPTPPPVTPPPAAPPAPSAPPSAPMPSDVPPKQ